MKGQIIKDWNKVDHVKLFGGDFGEGQDVRHQKAVQKALQFFFALPNQFVPEKFADDDLFKEKRKAYTEAKVQYFATLNDFPATAKEVVDKYHELAVYDNGFEQIFNIRDFTGSRRDGFSIDTIAGGLAFRKMLTGEKLHVYQFAGDREYVYFDYYGGALGWDRKLFENQEWWTLEENAIEFRNEAYRIRAATFYALLEAVAALKADIGWQLHPDGVPTTNRGYRAGRDAATMNLAAQTILLACQASGYGISAQNVNFIILAPVQLRARIKQALGMSYDTADRITTVIDYNFNTVITTMLAVTDHYWVILPKRKIVGGDRMNLTTYASFDMLSRTDSAAGWMAFAGAVGDIAQLERCDIA